MGAALVPPLLIERLMVGSGLALIQVKAFLGRGGQANHAVSRQAEPRPVN
jgi:hypothetical protein